MSTAAEVTIRAADAADLDAIRRVGQETWPETYGFAGPDYIAHGLATWWSEAAITRSLAETTVLVAERDGEIIGLGNLDHTQDVPVIWKLYVLPSAQGSGAGSALLQALVATAEGPVRLEYLDGNEKAGGFYRRHGFVEIGREPDPDPRRPAAVWMEHPGPTAAG